MQSLNRRRGYGSFVPDWLKLTALVSGTFTFKINGSRPGTMTSISYSIDGGRTWVTSNGTSDIVTPTIAAGDSVYFKGIGTATAKDSTGFYYFSSTGNFDVSGNIMSLLYGDNFSSNGTLSSNYTFAYLFLNSYVKDASGLKLPAKYLSASCYESMFASSRLSKAPDINVKNADTFCFKYMFQRCTMLTSAPSLIVDKLASACCTAMFDGCTALTSAPSLSNTSLGDYCYQNMFYGCTALTTAPILPATTLKQGCYNSMFEGCSNLSYIKAMFTTTQGSYFTKNWVKGVKASGTFVKNSLATWDLSGDSGIPSGWTVQTASK